MGLRSLPGSHEGFHYFLDHLFALETLFIPIYNLLPLELQFCLCGLMTSIMFFLSPIKIKNHRSKVENICLKGISERYKEKGREREEFWVVAVLLRILKTNLKRPPKWPFSSKKTNFKFWEKEKPRKSSNTQLRHVILARSTRFSCQSIPLNWSL